MTEKYFQALMAGTIPVVYGAPNIHEYEPQPNSILVLRDFANISALAQRMKELAADPVAYASMLRWKTEGLSDTFRAVMDFTTVHSECRLCIRIADDYSAKHGEVNGRIHRDYLNKLQALAGREVIFVRERHTFYFRPIAMPSTRTVSSLHLAIATAFSDTVPLWSRVRNFSGAFSVFSVYKAGVSARDADGPARISLDTHVAELTNSTYLEAVFV